MARKMKAKRNLRNQAHKQPTVKAWLKELGILFGVFFVLNSFLLASFEVPTGSMENEVMTGDFLLVNKFIFGGTTPKTIPFTNTRIPSFQLPAARAVARGDVIVFVFPGMRDEVEPATFAYYLKRCLAVAGDTLQIVDRVVYVNGQPVPMPHNIKFDSARIEPSGSVDPRIFPKGAPFNADNYGPIVIPKKGDVIKLSAANFEQWEIFIRREGHSAEQLNRKVYIDGREVDRYTVGRNYVFGMGDHRDNSLDSRFWGFIPVDAIIGTPLVVFWSWDPNLSLFNIFDKFSSIQWKRVGTVVR